MADKTRLVFHSGSRKLFAEESYVIDAVERAKRDIARRRGYAGQGAALFKIFARAPVCPMAHPRALDIVNAAVGSGAADLPAAIACGDSRSSGISGIAQAQGEVAESLRRLGVRR